MKSDDIEDLFREAAEKYQIDTEKAAAWDDVYEAVHGDDKPAQPPHPEGGNKKRWLNLLWLLLIPLGWFAHNAWNDIHKGNSLQKQQVTAAGNKDTDNKDDKSMAASAGKTATGNTQTVAESNNNGVNDKNSASKNKGVFTIQSSKTAISRQSTGAISKTADRKNKVAGMVLNGSPVTGNSNAKTDVTSKTGILKNSSPVNSNPVTGNDDGSGKTSTGQVEAQTNKIIAGAQQGQAADKKDSKDNKKPGTDKQRFFYLGLVASPDVSFIHFQKTSPVGVGTGLLAGYQFNKHLSVETGVLFDSKNYYSKGQYFDKNKIPYFQQHPEINVNSVTGDCRMIEIPVNVRYAFSIKNKNTWYAIAGMSSYLMGHEYYDYNYTDWGNPYTRSAAYNNHTKNWFSIANFGIGYQRSLGTKTNIRFEPFIKVPVSGVGTGNMSITSTGLYIGITRRIP